MKEKFRKFMAGRYGADILSRDLITLVLLMSFMNMFLKNTVLGVISTGVLLYSFYRSFSKNINKRYRENQKYLEIIKPIRKKQARLKRKWDTRKEYKYFKCEQCKKDLRVPRGEGLIEITCPHCKKKLLRRS